MSLHYDVVGDGPLLGYSHGNLFSPRVEDAIGILDWSRAGRRVVRAHLRGHGLTPGEPGPALYTWPAHATDLLTVADRVAGSEAVDWAGSSLGAGALLWAAVERPARFRRLVLMSPPTVRDGRLGSVRGYRAGAATVERDGKGAWIRALRRFPKPPIFADVPTWEFDADVPEALLPSMLRGAALSDLPDDDALRTITQPVLILAWEKDPAHPVPSAELLAGVLPNAFSHISGTVADIRTWPERIGEFLNS